MVALGFANWVNIQLISTMMTAAGVEADVADVYILTGT